MARTDPFAGVAEFLAVARHASFRAAAAQLGVTSSAVSQAIRSFETKIGLPLFQRTTRNVALTEAGRLLLTELSPAAASITEALDNVAALRSRPAGHLRLTVPRIAMELVLWELVPGFRKAYPDVTLDIDVNDAQVDLGAQQFDAGVRLGRHIERDMVAVRLTPDFRCVVVATPRYLRAHGRPSAPDDLVAHDCIRYRHPTAGSVYRWEFTRGRKTYSVEPRGALTVNDHRSVVELACRGAGLAYSMDLVVQAALAQGRLESVLQAFLPPRPGLFLYFPARSQRQPKLRAFIDFVKASL
jgi:DNA-binding transcriptional LysR family regulator